MTQHSGVNSLPSLLAALHLVPGTPGGAVSTVHCTLEGGAAGTARQFDRDASCIAVEHILRPVEQN